MRGGGGLHLNVHRLLLKQVQNYLATTEHIKREHIKSHMGVLLMCQCQQSLQQRLCLVGKLYVPPY